MGSVSGQIEALVVLLVCLVAPLCLALQFQDGQPLQSFAGNDLLGDSSRDGDQYLFGASIEPQQQLADILATSYLMLPRNEYKGGELNDDLLDLKDEENSRETRSEFGDDVNSHLPANSPFGNTISGPVNDPAEFEAQLGQLTDRLNHKLPNSQNRSELIDSLLRLSFAEGPLLGEPLDRFVDNLKPPVGLKSELSTAWPEEQDAPKMVRDEADEDDSTAAPGGNSLQQIVGEYIDRPLALAGHQYVQGGAGEGRQLLGPDGTFENVQVIKSDFAVPAYCEPPNPCPIGYTAKDNCLEEFVNSASFSREYQAKQRCSCDNEHSLFNCAAPSSGGGGNSLKQTKTGQANKPQAGGASVGNEARGESGDGDRADGPNGDQDDDEGGAQKGSKLDTLVRAIKNRFGDLGSIRNLIAKHEHDLD